jgi:hypothetical protein
MPPRSGRRRLVRAQNLSRTDPIQNIDQPNRGKKSMKKKIYDVEKGFDPGQPGDLLPVE